MAQKEYVLLGRSFRRVDSDGATTERYKRGDLVKLSDAEYQRLGKSFEVPGSSQKAEAEKLRAKAERLSAEAEAIESQADEAENAPLVEPEPGEENLNDLTVDELNERLDAADLPKSGNKAEKVDRLREAG